MLVPMESVSRFMFIFDVPVPQSVAKVHPNINIETEIPLQLKLILKSHVFVKKRKHGSCYRVMLVWVPGT